MPPLVGDHVPYGRMDGLRPDLLLVCGCVVQDPLNLSGGDEALINKYQVRRLPMGYDR